MHAFGRGSLLFSPKCNPLKYKTPLRVLQFPPRYKTGGLYIWGEGIGINWNRKYQNSSAEWKFQRRNGSQGEAAAFYTPFLIFVFILA